MPWPWQSQGHDIELPNESGRRDPRLPPKPLTPDEIQEHLKQARGGYDKLEALRQQLKQRQGR